MQEANKSHAFHFRCLHNTIEDNCLCSQWRQISRTSTGQKSKPQPPTHPHTRVEVSSRWTVGLGVKGHEMETLGGFKPCLGDHKRVDMSVAGYKRSLPKKTDILDLIKLVH